MASQIRVDQVVDVAGPGAPELTYGATLASGGTFDVSGNLNITGIATVGVVTATNVVAGFVTASNFAGDGSQLTGLTVLGESKAIAFAIIQS